MCVCVCVCVCMAALSLTENPFPDAGSVGLKAVIHVHLVGKFGVCGAVPTFFRMDSWHVAW
jgi:hypothetical protein